MYDNIIKLAELTSIKDRILRLESTNINDELLLHITLTAVDSDCPYCLSPKIKVKEYKFVKITHSISSTRKVYIKYRRRRYVCSFCSKSFYETNPFTDFKHRVSKLTIMNILEYLKDEKHTFKSAGINYNVSTQTVINIFDSYIKPKRKPLPRVLCIDEVHVKSNTKYSYACVLLDFETNKLTDVLITRHKKYLKDYFARMTLRELNSVEIVVMDMWSPYKDVVRRFMPKAKIVVDSFHVVALINKIFDKKRIQVMNSYREIKNKNYTNDYYYLLKSFSWMLRMKKTKVHPIYYRIHKYKMSVYKTDLIDHLLNSDKELRMFYNLKEKYMYFNNDSSMDDAKERLSNLIDIFRNHKNIEIRAYGRTIHRWRKEIINSFTRSKGKRYSNGKLEGRNRQIKTIIRNSLGYKNFERFRARVMYSVNKDVPLNLRNK